MILYMLVSIDILVVMLPEYFNYIVIVIRRIDICIYTSFLVASASSGFLELPCTRHQGFSIIVSETSISKFSFSRNLNELYSLVSI